MSMLLYLVYDILNLWTRFLWALVAHSYMYVWTRSTQFIVYVVVYYNPIGSKASHGEGFMDSIKAQPWEPHENQYHY